MMTAVGKGRGNWGSKDLSAPLRRPGDASRASGGEEDIILREIASMDINDQRKLETIEDSIKKYCNNREHLWRISQKMYESGAKDRSMVQKMVKFWKNLSNFEVNDVKLRSVLMTTAQKDFEEREEVRKEDPERFLNAVALFGGIFHYMTLPGGEIFSVLVSPMMEYLNLLLKEDSKVIPRREAELEMLAIQVNLNGVSLQENDKESMQKLALLIRNALITSTLSARCHYWLLLVLDLSVYGWNVQGLPPFLNTFYSEKLGNSFKQLMDCNISRQSLKDEPKLILTKTKSEEAPVMTKKPEVRFSFEHNSQKKDFHNDKSSVGVAWQDGSGDYKDKKKPPYWGHDDRFDDAQDSGSYGSHGFSDRGGRRGGGGGVSGGGGGSGGGGWANWRERGDSKPQRNREDNSGRKWNDDFQSGYKPKMAEPEENWD